MCPLMDSIYIVLLLRYMPLLPNSAMSTEALLRSKTKVLSKATQWLRKCQ